MGQWMLVPRVEEMIDMRIMRGVSIRTISHKVNHEMYDLYVHCGNRADCANMNDVRSVDHTNCFNMDLCLYVWDTYNEY